MTAPQSSPRALFAGLLLLLAALPIFAQDFGTDSRPAPSPSATERAEANAAMEARDYPRALRLLTPLVSANAGDARLVYDLGSAQDALDQTAAAEKSYRAAIAADPRFPDPHVALGLLLARNSRLPEARAEFVLASTLPYAGDSGKLLRARAFRSLARIDQRTRPGDALDELLQALKLSPETPEDTLLSAELAQTTPGEAGAAEATLRRLLQARPNDPEPTAALAHLLLQTKRAADADALLSAALAAHPGDLPLSVQLASTYAAEGKTAPALALLKPLHAANPSDAGLTRLLAGLLLQALDYTAAEPLLATLTVLAPQDVGLADERADALIHLKRFAEAEQILTRALAQPTLFPSPAALAAAAGHLAFAASENNDPQTCLQAIKMRATVSPPSAPILFLAAISYDKMHETKQAEEAYKKFLLAAADGVLPDEVFEARHRLIALERRK